jgi:hypothetical protein
MISKPLSFLSFRRGVLRVPCPRLRGHARDSPGRPRMPTKTWAWHPTSVIPNSLSCVTGCAESGRNRIHISLEIAPGPESRMSNLSPSPDTIPGWVLTRLDAITSDPAGAYAAYRADSVQRKSARSSQVSWAALDSNQRLPPCEGAHRPAVLLRNLGAAKLLREIADPRKA